MVFAFPDERWLPKSALCARDYNPDFIWRLDQRRYAQMKTLVLVLADGIPEQLAKIEKAKTLTDIQRVFIETVDESTTTSQ